MEQSKNIEKDTHALVDANASADAHGAEEGVAASLGLNGQLFVFQIINFAIVVAIVWFLILKPLTKKLEERKKIIDESIDNAKEVESNLEMSERKFNEKVAEAKKEANSIIEKSHKEADVLAKQMKENAEAEVKKIVEQARAAIEKDKESMRKSLRKETVELVILAVEKLIGEKLDAAKDEKFIKDIISSVDK